MTAAKSPAPAKSPGPDPTASEHYQKGLAEGRADRETHPQMPIYAEARVSDAQKRLAGFKRRNDADALWLRGFLAGWQDSAEQAA